VCVRCCLQVESPKQISLTKLYGRKWRTDGPGPLKIVGVDTGGGILRLEEKDGGRLIAEVQADLEGHGVTVEGHVELKVRHCVLEQLVLRVAAVLAVNTLL
jgi:hypothetical protein